MSTHKVRSANNTDQSGKLRAHIISKIRPVIRMCLWKINTINTNWSSYRLKHLLESAIGEYVFEQEAQQAMKLEGYMAVKTDWLPSYDHPQSYYYNVSGKACKVLNDKNNKMLEGWTKIHQVVITKKDIEK